MAPHAPATGMAELGSVDGTAMDCTAWKTLKVEIGGLSVLMIMRTLPCGAMHLPVDPLHDYMRPKITLGRWLSEIRVGSDLGLLWLRFCSA